MSFVYTLAWWHVPTLATLLSLAWAFFWPAEDGGYMGGLMRVFMLIGALIIVALAWMVGGFLK